ncbi:MAG TPA: arylsulfatase [Chthoniobacteraceae bacterium]|nr:arylsulfatase [Chthoniobacteraceae bacterium]
MRFCFLLATALFACALSLSAVEKPNIIFILADDIGYGDLGSYGATRVKTPVLDQLAKDGCRFTDAHSPASTCTPTRRAFLTGTYSWRRKPGSSIAPGDAPLSIAPGTHTVASILKQSGYKTGVVGKWHLGLGGEGGPDWNGDIKPGPLEIGFDYCFMMPATGDRVPCVYMEDHRILGLDPADPIKVSYKEKVGSDSTGKENPGQLKLKHTHGHDMTIVNGVGRIGWMTGGKAARWRDEDMADTFTTKAIEFIEREKDAPFFLYFATHNIHVPRVPHERFNGTSGAGIRGDAIHELDDSVGKLLAALDRLKLSEKTLVIFTSDNGGVNDDGYEDFGPLDHKMNGTLRGTKGTLFEGGHRVPFIARWPGTIKAGTESNALITHLDMPATFAALSGTKVPDGAAPDSINVMATLLGNPTLKAERDTFIAHNGGIQGPFAIRHGTWKFIQPGRGGYGKAAKGEDAKPAPAGQLFNLSEDPSEQNNLVDKMPEKSKELAAMIQAAR